MGIDFSLTDSHPAVIINDEKYHYGKSPEFDEYLVESAAYEKDYWCFKTEKDLVAFLINLPESAERNRIFAKYPDWSEVSHEQRTAYINQNMADQRALAMEKIRAGTAQRFNLDFEGKHGPYAPQQIAGVDRGADNAAEFKRYVAELVDLAFGPNPSDGRTPAGPEGRGIQQQTDPARKPVGATQDPPQQPDHALKPGIRRNL